MTTFLLTWTCYGTWLHGDRRGSVDRHHNRHGDEFLVADDDHVAEMQEAMAQPPYELDGDRREVVLGAIVGYARKKFFA